MPSAPPSCSRCAPSTTAARGRTPTPPTRRARCRPTTSPTWKPSACRRAAGWSGVEITDEAIELPSFRHPRQAAYILGAEREGLSADVQSICDYVVKIPTRFSVNLGVAGALIMYDRQLSLGRHAARPVAEGGPTEAVVVPPFGEPIYKRKQRARARAAQAHK